MKNLLKNKSTRKSYQCLHDGALWVRILLVWLYMVRLPRVPTEFLWVLRDFQLGETVLWTLLRKCPVSKPKLNYKASVLTNLANHCLATSIRNFHRTFCELRKSSRNLTSPNLSNLIYVSLRPNPISDRLCLLEVRVKGSASLPEAWACLAR